MTAAHPPTSSLALTALALAAATDAGETRFVAVRFRGGEVLQLLDSGVDERAASQALRDWAASLPIVVAGAEVATAALERSGTARSSPVWDVLELAGLLAPDCPTTSLAAAAAFFGLGPADGGLAGHARLVMALFGRLVEQLAQLDAATLAHVNRLAAPLDWPLRLLFGEVERRRARLLLERGGPVPAPVAGWLMPEPPARRRAHPPPSSPRRIEPAEAAEELGPCGPIARALPGYEQRHEQLRMAELVAATLSDGGRLLIEAPTGVGKSLAYLVPAARLALQNGWRVVVSTATTTLQDQLFQKDLPVVQASLGQGQRLRAMVLKGRANYLCLRRWRTQLEASDLLRHDRMLLIKTLFWLPRTRSGDRAELRLAPGEEEAWQRVNALAEACTPTRCPYHRVGGCFVARARRAAEESQVVIVNHALLLSDLVTGSRVLPEYQALIVDEAHHLEAEATTQLGWRVGERELAGRLERLWSEAGGTHGPGGAVPEALSLLGGPAAGIGPEPELCERGVREAARLVRGFFQCLGRQLEDAGAGEDGPSLRLTGATRAGSLWQAAEVVWDEATRQLLGLERIVAELQRRLEDEAAAAEQARHLAAELGGQLDYWRGLRQRFNAAVHGDAPESRTTVYWLSGSGGRSASARGAGGRTPSVWLSAAPLEVSGLLGDGLFAPARAAVLVSATLAVAGSFDYVKRRLGLADASAVALGSPFDYQRAALLYVPDDLPDPTQPGYQRLLEQVLLDTIARVDGRTLALFTSRAQLRATHAALREPLAARGITLLGQGVDEASRTRLLEAFRGGSRVALLGTASFWEGIDVVGEALSCLVIARLPFAVPSEPVYAARAEQFDDPFGEFALPQAVLRLKQGFGRLIRSRADRGAVVVLDCRLVTRRYGSIFLRSLPGCPVRRGPAAGTGAAVAEWLARTPAAGRPEPVEPAHPARRASRATERGAPRRR